MSDDTIGDANLEEKSKNIEHMKEMDNAANEVVAEVTASIEVTEEDKKEAARKKKEQAKIDSEAALALDLQKDLEGFIQDKIDMSTSDGIIERLPTGIDVLDAILGGGFGLGTFSQIVGNPGTFKSALLGQLIGQAQKKYNGKLLTAYYDSEVAMTTDRLSQLGVNNPKIRPYDNMVSVEKIFKTIEAFVSFKAVREIDHPGIIAWDSIANTSVEKDFTTDDVNQTIGLKARILSALFPRYIPKLKDNNIALIAINQLREKLDMGMYSAPNDLKWLGDKVIPGGQAVKFNSFHLLHLRARNDLKYEKYGFNGLMVEARCIKNKFFKPNVPVELIIDFNTGISNFWTNLNFLEKTKRITGTNWKSFVADTSVKFQNKSAKDMYDNNTKNFKDIFDKEIVEAIRVEILEK